MSHQTKAVFQMALCAALWSIAGLFIGFLPWHPMAIAGWRSFFAFLVVAAFMAVKKVRVVFSKKVFINMFFMAGTFICFVSANKLTTSANAILLQFTSPVFVMLFSVIFLRRRFYLSDYLTAFMTIGGIAVFFLDSLNAGHTLGNILGVGAGVFMAAMLVAVTQVGEDEKLSGILFGQLLTALLGIPFSFFAPFSVNLSAVVSIVVLGVFQLGIPYLLLGQSSRYCPALAMCLLGGIEPILNPVWVAIFTGVIPGTMSFIGGAIVLVGVTAQCLLNNRRTKKMMRALHNSVK